ncbi:hypothetical protein FE257_010991 [Aspergillus nanangensis]|uniref:Glutathione S-transferase n=1 Tax=Aspergillus nanangensis TaxID=2582783 RepID=A0AAD4CIK6_ASPNN|nr:hypothetical protein FE257_010991 [Aspergillus nanangensis]
MLTPDITLYSEPTPNGVKVSIVLEELGLPYKAQSINLTKDEQKEEWFLKINPNGRIPAITDGKLRVFESAAIMLYLADKYDTDRKISYSPETPQYCEQLSWLMWQMAGLGPNQGSFLPLDIASQVVLIPDDMTGQANHFLIFAPVRSDWAIKRFKDETKRLYSVLDARLQESPYLAGDKYTIADIASFAWVRRVDVMDLDIAEWPALKKWCDGIEQREAVQKGLSVPPPSLSPEQLTELLVTKKREMRQKGNSDVE